MIHSLCSAQAVRPYLYVCMCVYMLQGHGMSSHGLHSADASERHAYSAHVICGLHQACLEAAPVALGHALQCMFPHPSVA